MAGGLTGSLADWALPELLNMLGSSRQSGRLEIDDRGVRGLIYLQEGAVVHATVDSEMGTSAFATLFGWKAGTFSFEPRVPTPAATIASDLETLLTEVQLDLEEREAIRRVIPSVDASGRLRAPAGNDDLTMTMDDWRLLAALANGARVSDLVVESGRELRSIERALCALAGRGLVAFEDGLKPAAQPTQQEPVRMEAPRQASAPETAPAAVQVTPPTPVAVAPAPQTAPPVALPVQAAPTVTPAGPRFFHDLETAAAAALGPLARVIIEDTLEAMGARAETFPRQRAAQLVEIIAREVRDDRRRAEFQSQMLRVLRAA